MYEREKWFIEVPIVFAAKTAIIIDWTAGRSLIDLNNGSHASIYPLSMLKSEGMVRVSRKSYAFTHESLPYPDCPARPAPDDGRA
jgi:hypothetical protein